MRIIGDVHGKTDQYKQLIANVDHSIQLGDFGFRTQWERLVDVNANNHKIIGGNHDDYDFAPTTDHYLGEYGGLNFHGFEFYFVRGAYSVDKNMRTAGIDWWYGEQLKIRDFYEMVDGFKNTKPEIVLSHDCPESILPYFLSNTDKIWPSVTNQGLQFLLESHLPKLWIFGHHHKSKAININGTVFLCLGELDYFDYDITLNVNDNIKKILQQFFNYTG